jgi:hypothetical protein
MMADLTALEVDGSIQVTIDIYGHRVSDRGQIEAAKTDTFLTCG